jgi:hypothetical protein
MSELNLDSTEEEQEVDPSASALQKVWISRIKAEEKSHRKWRDRGHEVEQVFNDDFGASGAGDDELYVPLLWSVVQVEHAGVFSSQPVPDVRPANDEDNESFRKASDIIERGIAHFVDEQSFDDNMHRSVDDYLAMGMGTIRVKMDSEIIDVPINQEPPPPDIAAQMNEEDRQAFEEAQQRTEKGIGNQSISWEYVPWDRFLWEPCNSWRNCEWIGFRHRMTGLQQKERFGKTFKATKDPKDKNDKTSWQKKTYDIYEIWDKKHRRQLFLAKGEDEPIEVNKDPLGLAGFFPIPYPMMTNLPSGELLPKPDYDYIEPYDMELNRLQERRMALIEQLKAVGGHDKGMPELGDIFEQEDGQSLPISNLAQRTAGGDFKNVMFSLPLEEKVIVLGKLVEQIQFVKASVDEVMGIADIVRGVSNANEGVGTQEIKGRWVGIRLSRKRDTVQYTIREMFRIMAQLLTTHFTDENLVRLTQVEIDPQTLSLIRNDMLMDFAIDVETESTVAKDEFQERRSRQEMLTSVGSYAQSVLPMVQQGLMPADVSSAILKAALQPYAKYSRAMDESMASLQTTTEQLQQMNGQIQELTQQNQQVTQEKQQWETVARTLQTQSTEAASIQKQADARKKVAETAKINQGLEDDGIQVLKTAADIDNTNADTSNKEMDTVKKRAETFDILNPPPQGRVQ